MWERIALPEVLAFREGPGILAKDFRSTGIPLIRLAGLRGQSLIEGCNFLDQADVVKRWSQFRLRLGDTLLSTSASLGEVATVDSAGVGAVPYTGIIGFRPKDSRVAPEFIPLMLKEPSFKRQIEAMGVGSVMNHFGPSHLRHMSVTLPPRHEQQAIAEVLGALDDKIAANTAFGATVDRYLATLLDEMASGVTVTTLRSIADVNRRSVKPQADGNLRYVDIASVTMGSFEYPEVRAWSDAPGRARRALSAGDTMWSTVRPNRRSHALNLEDDALLVASTGLAILSPREVGFAYLYEASRRPEFATYLENVAEGSAYPAVRSDRFLEAPVPDLPANYIHAFEDQAAPLRKLVASQTRENRILAATRDALLPQLMSGKLRVRDAEAAASEAGA